MLGGYAHTKPPLDYHDFKVHERTTDRARDVRGWMRDQRTDNHSMPNEQPDYPYFKDTIKGPHKNEEKGSKLTDPVDTTMGYSVDSNHDEGGAYGYSYQASVKTKELSEGSPPKLNHFPLLQLPREIRDQVRTFNAKPFQLAKTETDSISTPCRSMGILWIYTHRCQTASPHSNARATAVLVSTSPTVPPGNVNSMKFATIIAT